MVLMLTLAAITLLATVAGAGDSSCPKGCDLALASYSISRYENLTGIASFFSIGNYHQVLPYNPNTSSADSIIAGERISIPFTCSCVPAAGNILAGQFEYTVSKGDTYDSVADTTHANLTTAADLQKVNSYPPNNIPEGALINWTVRCFCGDASVSKDYGLFLTYPLSAGDTADSLATQYNVPANLLRAFNPSVDFTNLSAIVFIPVKDPSGSYRPLKLSTSGGAIAGIVIGFAVGVLLVVIALYIFVYKRWRQKKGGSLLTSGGFIEFGTASSADGRQNSQSDSMTNDARTIVDKSVEFSFEELSAATNEFSLSNKIGQGGYGSVYYAELRGEKAAIKKMDMQSSEAFLAELKVLTRVHHLNLVRLIGYCIENSLFLVYEYIDNGNLSQHLRASGWDPLPWAARVQIALDSARGLEYIHEHTVPVYIHRDIKSANILIDKNLRAKVADFGLTKLTEVGSISLPTRVAGTFGYMPPEYARYGDVSPKVDVYAFGVVLYELISAKEAIVKLNESGVEAKGLVYLFEEALGCPDPKEALRKLADPKLGADYPIDSALKMANLAKACTSIDPKERPTMRSVVVTLMTLSSTTEFWDMNPLIENQGLIGLMSGR